jgi:polysaccharide pyruvyl transferase WcaK-like protein
VRVKLLTPYTGDNLGDAAIQDAVIAALRRRWPDSEIELITLSPEATTARHGVPSFPLSTLVYWRDAEPRGGRRPWPLRALAASRRGLKTAARELVHIARAGRHLRGTDLLIVSGGGQLDDYWGGPWCHPYSLLKWGVLARLAGAKVVFLSVGSGLVASRVSAVLLRWALRLAAYRSYRDEVSKQSLASLAFTRRDRVYPDLAFSHPHGGPDASTSSGNGARVIAVSPIAYLSPYGWPKTDAAVYRRYFDCLVAFVAAILGQGRSVVLFATDTPDRRVVCDIAEALARQGAQGTDRRLRVISADTPGELLQQLAPADLVVASRLHGVLLAHLLAIPVLAISYDRKIDTHMAEMGCSEYCLDLHRVELDGLLARLEALTAAASPIREALAARRTAYAGALETQYDAVLGSATCER